MHFVLDCSVAISWCLVDENNDYANAILVIMPDAEAFVELKDFINYLSIKKTSCLSLYSYFI